MKKLFLILAASTAALFAALGVNSTRTFGPRPAEAVTCGKQPEPQSTDAALCRCASATDGSTCNRTFGYECGGSLKFPPSGGADCKLKCSFSPDGTDTRCKKGSGSGSGGSTSGGSKGSRK